MIQYYIHTIWAWFCSHFALLPESNTKPVAEPAFVDDDGGSGSANAQLASLTYDFHDKTLNGRRAEALLSDTFLNACIDNIAYRYRQELEAADPDLDVLRVAQIRLRAIKDFRTELRRHLTNAKLFDVELQRRKMSEEMSRFP